MADTLFALSKAAPEVLRLGPDGRVLARARPAERPAKLVLAAALDGSAPPRAIVSAATGATLTSYDAATLGDPNARALDLRPNLLSPSPTGRHLAVGDTGAGVVVLLDAVDLREVARATGLRGAHDLRFSEAGDRLFVSTLGAGRLVALDGKTLAHEQSTVIAGLPHGIDHTVRTPDGSLGLVVSPAVARITPVALNSLAPQPAIALPSPPARAFVGALGETAWLPAAGAPELHRLDLVGGTVNTTALPATARTLSPEPFADTLLVATLSGLVRVDADGAVVEAQALQNPVTRILPIEGAVLSLLIHADGSVSRQGAHTPLGPEALSAPKVFAASTAHALAFCHN